MLNMDHVTVNVPVSNGRRSGNDSPKKNKPSLGRALRNKTTAIVVGIILTLAILVFGGWTFYNSTMGSSIDTSKYQAVFFSNGQVYFGKLHTLNGGYMKLTDVFYLQTKTADSTKLQDAGTQSNPGVELIKLGSEIHGPTDEMIISKDQILFFENLKTDGTVTTSITKFKNDKK